ncbi:MAG: hypothetical protein HUJ63_11725, partial [Enterococcus sp.]|nr:hypothetical protein [Enterococcus sp.]
LAWPYIVSIILLGIIGNLVATGEFSINYTLGDQPFGIWFLAVLFAFRFLQNGLLKIPHIFGLSIILLFVSGLFEILSQDFFAYSRMITYLWSFLLGYYITLEQVEKIRKIRWYWGVLLGIGLTACSHIINITYGSPYDKVFQVKASYASLGVDWYTGMGLRLVGLLISIGWIIVMLSIFSSKKGFFAWLGAHTMPMYIFHLIVRILMIRYTVTFGLFTMPDNNLLYWLYIIGVSVLISVFSASRLGQFIYDIFYDYSYKGATFIVKKLILPISQYFEIPFKKVRDLLDK